MSWLRGRKTYLLAAAALLSILARYADGKATLEQAITEALVATGLVTSRAGAKADDAAKS